MELRIASSNEMNNQLKLSFKVGNLILIKFLREFWPEERKMVENNYRDIRLPFIEINAPTFSMSSEWNLFQLFGYLYTWSAVKKYRKKYGANPVKNIQDEVSKIWGKPIKTHQVKWPLSIRLWQKNT